MWTLIIILYLLPPIVLIIHGEIKEPAFQGEKWLYLIVLAIGTPAMIFAGIWFLVESVRGAKELKSRVRELETEVSCLKSENCGLQDVMDRHKRAHAVYKKQAIAHLKEANQEIKFLNNKIENLKDNDPYEQIKKEIGL